MAAGRLAFTPEAGNAVHDASVVFICVGTPPRADGEVNLLAVERCAIEIARHAGDEVVVVEKSTGPAGTADRVRLTLAREGGSQRFDIASNPEFLREGSALRDALEPDRIVIGVESERASTVMRLLSEPLTRKGFSVYRGRHPHGRAGQAREQRLPSAQDLLREWTGSDL
jgi:UDPglucose 6-dehydrogenase